MQATIITIGDELLYGQTIDTNSAYMGRELALLGIRVREILSISDDKSAILEALARAEQASNLVLITGGLGPTKDDITKVTLAQYFNTTLVRNQEILAQLEAFFASRNRPMLQSNADQALMPASCTPLRNDRGTAWGMWFEKNGKVFVSMPGVPFEMEALMQQEVLPKVKTYFQLPVIIHKHILTAGIGESFLAEQIADFEDNLPTNIKLAYLPGIGSVKLRLTANGTNREVVQEALDVEVAKLVAQIDKHIYGYDDDQLEEIIGKLLTAKDKTLATAESCTGGYIASQITMVAGSSAYYNGSVVSYTDESKHALLGVKQETLDSFGAVSEETVREMLLGVCAKFGTDYAIATSGIAGPAGGTPDKPVGTVWVAYGSPTGMRTKKLTFKGNRKQNIQLTALMALELFRKYLIEI
jgi:nicotinamide-nucleotide amidase